MASQRLHVRELQNSDIPKIISYWLNSDPEFMKGMGVDVTKIPGETEWILMLEEQLSQDYKDKRSYCLIWEIDGQPIGHSNVNKIIFGTEAYMHLHIWYPEFRNKGLGLQFVKLGLPLFFKNMELQKIYCEPYALNPAPNKTIEKAGFTFIKEYITTPGSLNFEQKVKLWEKLRP
jgi:RimJ/RimL family protein N-acetyltransferase